MKKRKTGLWISLIVFLVVIVVVGYFVVKNKNSDSELKPEKPQLVEYTVKKTQIFESLKETGELEPVQSVEITSKLSGKLLKFLVKEGESIKKGQIIAYLEPDISEIQRITSIRSNYENAKTELEIARKDFNQKRSLYEKGIISEKEYLDSKKRITSAENSFFSSQQHIRSIRDLGLPENIENIERVEITAPNSGVLINLGVEEGESVRAGTNAYGEGTIVAVVADISRMKVSAKINEVDIGKIHLNQEVIITLDAFPRDKFEGRISFISPIAQPAGNLKKFDILIDVMKADPRLHPGMTANLDIVLVNKSDIIVIPFGGIVMQEQTPHVRMKDSSGDPGKTVKNNKNNIPKFKLVEVQSGIKGRQGIEIVSGLKTGDIIYVTKSKGGFPMPGGSNNNSNSRHRR